MFRLVTLSVLIGTTTAFFFGGGGGGGCGCQPAPACAPHPAPAPCSGGNIVQGYVGAPQGGYGGSYAAPQQGGYAAPQGGYQAPPPPPPMGYAGAPQPAPQAPYAPQPAPQAPQGYEAPAQVAPAAQEPVQAGGAYQDTPVQVAQVAPAAQEVAQPPSDAAYTGEQEEQEVVASLAREEPNYQNTGTNVLEAAQHASEQGSQAAAAAAKNAEVVEEDEPVKKKTKEAGKTNMVKKVPTTTTTTTEFPIGEEIVPDTTEKEVDISELHLTDDPLCNSDDLRKVVIDNIDDQLNSSKRMIQLAAEAQFGGRFDVICANGDFSYVTNTELYCQETKGDISCYTYRQL